VEHEALTSTNNGHETPSITSKQMNDSRQLSSSGRCFSMIQKNQISIQIISVLLIIVIITGVVLSVVLYDVKKDSSVNPNAIEIPIQKSRTDNYLLRTIPSYTKNSQMHPDQVPEDVLQPDWQHLDTASYSSQNKLMRPKIKRIISQYTKQMESEQEFERRYPRDDLGRGKKRPYRPNWMRNPLLFKILQGKDNKNGNITLSNEEKVKLIIIGLDKNMDQRAGPWELLKWIEWVEEMFQGHVLEQQWRSVGVGVYHVDRSLTAVNASTNLKKESTASLGWADYQSMILPDGPKNKNDRQRMNQEWRRWRLADKDADNRLTKNEYKGFLFPHLLGAAVGNNEVREVIVSEAHDSLDSDFDGRVSKDEFLEAHKQSAADEEMFIAVDIEQNFEEDLDVDGDGYLDKKELIKWVEPEGFQGGKSEVVHLMDNLDIDESKDITNLEIMKNSELFLQSQVSYNGQLYKDKEFRKKVFIQNKKEDAIAT